MKSTPRRIPLWTISALLSVFALGLIHGAPAVRIKDLADVEGVRANALVGYGVVVGLQGTGDGTQARFTTQALANMLLRSQVNLPASAIRVKNVAAVMVTAELPAFVRKGQRIDVQVSSIGDAKSLQGGTLLMVPLYGADGTVARAVAQGSVSLGGAFLGGGGGNSVQKNHPTAGRVPRGGIVESDALTDLSAAKQLRLLLREPDFATAHRVASVINEYFGTILARAEDSVGIRIEPPQSLASDPVDLISQVQALEVRPDVTARIAINERTGTIVMGNAVRVSRVALAHGNLTIEVQTTYEASQPNPLSRSGETVVLPQQDVFVGEDPSRILKLDEGISVGELVDALNALGVSARDMIAIFQAMREAGALHAELVLM